MSIAESPTEQLGVPGRDTSPDVARRLAAVAAGVVLVVAGVAGVHHLARAGDGVGELLVWGGLLLGWFTALGGGVKLVQWGLKPVTTLFFATAKARLSEPAQAVIAALAMIAGGAGVWWVLRGGYTLWWQQLSDTSGWTLALGAGQMLIAVVSGAALFTGGRFVTGLVRELLTGVGGDEGAGAGHRMVRAGVQESVWHPGLLAALIGGGLGLVFLAAGIAPRLYVWITGPQVLPAAGAIAVVLVWAVGANLGWWHGLTGLFRWATDASQKAAAVTGVVAILAFSAGGLGLGWFTPETVPLARAACPPDCGGPGGLDGPPGGGQIFQPPSQGGPQMPDYQSGMNQPPLDQNNSISIYNTQVPSVSQNGSSGYQSSQGPQQGWDQPAHGTQMPDYQNATPYTQGPGKPNPDFPGNQPAQQGGQPNTGNQGAQPHQGVQQPQQGNQGVQQPQQQPAQEQPQQNPDSQRVEDLTRQLQEQQQQSTQDRQRIDDLTKQLDQQKQQQNNNQKLPHLPEQGKDKKKDQQDQDRDNQSGNNDLAALLLGAASTTRRRKQDDPEQPEQQQGPDTQALTQDGGQLASGLPGDIANTVSDGVNLGQSAGGAAQGFGSAAASGASLASSAQSGAVNPQDAITVVQGVSQGIQGTADAVNSGSQIASTWLENSGETAQLAADVNPQLKPQAQQIQQLSQAGGQVANLTGQVASGVSQVSGMVNTASSMGSGGMTEGTATSMAAPQGVVPAPPAPSQGSSGGIQQLNPAPQAAPQGLPQTVGDPGGKGKVDAPSIIKGVKDAPPPQRVDVSSLNRVGVTQQKTFSDSHVPSLNDSFEKVAPTKGDSFDLGTYSNGQMWTGDYYETAGADRGGRGGMYRIPASSDGKTAMGSPVRVAPPANNPDGSPRDPSSRLLPTGKADLGGGHDLVFASQVPSPRDDGGFVSNFTWAYNAANPDAAPTAINGISQLSGAATPDGKMVAVGNKGASGPRNMWLTPQIGSEGWLDPTKWTDLGAVTDGGGRENQVFALPGGGYGLLDSNGPIGIKTAQTLQQLASSPLTPLILNSNDNPLPNDPWLSSATNQLLQPYGPEVISVVPHGNGSTLTFLASQWVTDPTRAYRTILYTVNIGPS
ncbi:hypothetical protein [Mycobacteroides abscessus]|uniref:hypothetical protein n=1 Tax=Mycobacteroides abscessus TaxID=36809 RepID=UPI001F2B2824|nr:hypothetical protein [Mycobacteroides abscessus]